MKKNNRLAVAVLAALAASCQGRDPHYVDHPEVPEPPPPHVRTLEHKALFGTLPVDNRMQDPLMSFSANGWFGYLNDFSNYATLIHKVGPSPTKTPYIALPGVPNAVGAVVVGQMKAERGAFHVEVWLGREGEDTAIDPVRAVLAGLFVDGGEQAVDLEGDASSIVTVGGNTWERFSADVDDGPVGWAELLLTDHAAPHQTLLMGGAAAVSLAANPNASFVSSKKRALDALEAKVIAAVRERTRNLKETPTLRPALLPGVPPSAAR